MAIQTLPLSLPRYARELVRELEERTGTGLQVVIDEDLGWPSQVHLASRQGEPHLVVVDRAYSEHLPHFLVRGALLETAWEPRRGP